MCLIIVLHCKKTANDLTENCRKSTDIFFNLKITQCNVQFKIYAKHLYRKKKKNQYGKFLYINTVHWDVFYRLSLSTSLEFTE